MDYWKSIQKRRSNYALTPQSDLPRDSIEKIVHDTLFYIPSAFNMQSARTVLLFDKSHTALWDIVRDALRPLAADEEHWKQTEARVAGFANGFGTVLFLEDTAVVEEHKANFALYAAQFDAWAMQEQGMAQFAVWTALSANGMAVNLQHYNPLIDDTVKQRFDIPESWRLIAKMPFGKPSELPKYREYPPVDGRMLIRE